MSRRIALTVGGRFHFFHLARQLEKRGWLSEILTTFPPFKLKDESGIPPQKIRCSWIYHTAFLTLSRLGVSAYRLQPLQRLIREKFDIWARRRISPCDLLIGLSGSGLGVGPLVQQRGGKWICDRGSTHILHQIRILTEEYQAYGQAFREASQYAIDRELAEYERADHIVVPSRFVKQTFVHAGIESDRVSVAPYGANVSRFSPSGSPDKDAFTILFVGNFGLRKGAIALVEAFRQLSHPRKNLKVIGHVDPLIQQIISDSDLAGIEFIGFVSNKSLAEYYSKANVFVLPSIEEGLALVMAEAMACGCPVIATPNSGAEDLFSDGVEGFIVPPRDPAAIAARLQQLADDPALRQRMSEAALRRVKSIGGWDAYGETYAGIIDKVLSQPGR